MLKCAFGICTDQLDTPLLSSVSDPLGKPDLTRLVTSTRHLYLS